MDKEFLIALVVGSTGAVLALLALIMALLARFGATRANDEVGRLRQDLAQTQSADWMQDQELEAKLKIRKLMLEGIQRVKDEIDRLLRASEETRSSEEVLQSISESGRMFTRLIESHAEKLGDSERRAVEHAKDAAVELTFETRRITDGVSRLADIPQKDRETVMRLRSELSEAQLLLQGRMIDRLAKRALSGLRSA